MAHVKGQITKPHTASRTYRIAVIPGDGTGPEVIREGCKVLDDATQRAGATGEADDNRRVGEGHTPIITLRRQRSQPPPLRSRSKARTRPTFPAQIRRELCIALLPDGERRCGAPAG